MNGNGSFNIHGPDELMMEMVMSNATVCIARWTRDEVTISHGIMKHKSKLVCVTMSRIILLTTPHCRSEILTRPSKIAAMRHHPPMIYLGPTSPFLTSNQPPPLPPTPARTLTSLTSNHSEPTVTSDDNNISPIADPSVARQKAARALLLPQSLTGCNKITEDNSRVDTVRVKETHLAKKMLNISTPQLKALAQADTDQLPPLTPMMMPTIDMENLVNDTVSALLIDKEPFNGSLMEAVT